MLKDNYNFRYSWHYAHQKGNVRMPQDALHDDFVLDFLKQVFGDVWIKNFLNCYRCSVQFSLVDYREATLANLFIKL